MADRDWMLNPTAIQAAKACIVAVHNELGIKLKLSHPQFMDMLFEYAELTDAQSLADALAALAPIAGEEHRLKDKVGRDAGSSVVSMPGVAVNVTPDQRRSATSDETVVYRGKTFARFRDGKEFKGLYRGQPAYS